MNSANLILPTLSDRAMLVSLNIKSWAARKTDKKVTRETLSAQGASEGAGTFHKALLAKEALADLQTLAGEARQTWYAYSSPWLDDGQRIMTTLAYETFTDKIRVIRDAWMIARDRFVRGYPRYIEEAKEILFRNGRMFNEADYPAASTIESKFAFSVRIVNVPDADDFRANVGNDQAQIIKRQIEEATNSAITSAMQDVWARIGEDVGHMADKLSAYVGAIKTDGKNAKWEGKVVGIFRDSLVENVRDLVDRLPALNLTNDPKLNELYIKMRDRLCQYDAEALRTDGTLRNQVAQEAKAILEQVSDFMS
jgi:hypothetical protein